MAYEHILFSRDGGLVEVTLNRPDKLNAINADMMGELTDAFTKIAEHDHARAAILTGAGKVFSAGQDLDDPSVQPSTDGTAKLERTLTEGYNPFIELMLRTPKPIVVAVNGVAAGAAANIALAGDIVVAARSARFIQAFAKIGLIPDSGGTYLLPRLVGTARAMGLSLLGEAVTGEDAEALGLIWKSVDDGDVLNTARELGRRLAEGPTLGLGFSKEAIRASMHNDLPTQLSLEAELQGRAGRSNDYSEGVAAFREKRQPKFTGT